MDYSDYSRIMRRHMLGVQLAKSHYDIDEEVEDVNLHKAFNELDTYTGSEPDGFISKKEVKSFLKECKKHGVISKKQKKALMKAFRKLWGKSKRINFVKFKELVKSNEPWRKIFCRFNYTDILLCIAPEDCTPEDWLCWDKYYCQLEAKNPYCYNPPNCQHLKKGARIHCQDKWECENLKPADDPWCNNPPTCTDYDCLKKYMCDNYPENCLNGQYAHCDYRDKECLKEYNCKWLPESPQCLNFNICDINDWQCNEKWDCEHIRPADDPYCNNPPTCNKSDWDCLRKWECENYPQHPETCRLAFRSKMVVAKRAVKKAFKAKLAKLSKKARKVKVKTVKKAPAKKLFKKTAMKATAKRAMKANAKRAMRNAKAANKNAVKRTRKNVRKAVKKTTWKNIRKAVKKTTWKNIRKAVKSNEY